MAAVTGASASTFFLALILNSAFLSPLAAACGAACSGSNYGSGSGGSGSGSGFGYGGGSGYQPTNPVPTPSMGARCPTDALKLGVCANVLDLVKAKVGAPPVEQCCPLLNGLVELEAAVCLCTAIKANVLGINLDLPVHLSLVLNYCGLGVPTGFKCA